MEELKQCKKCKKSKPVSEFYKETKRPDGLKSYCKTCTQDNRTKEDRQKWNDEHIEDVLVWTARLRAKKRGIKFDLKQSDITIPTKCPLLGIPLYRGRGKPVHNSPTLDRINPANGYVKGNVWVISHRANSIKTSASYEEIIEVGQNLKKFVTGIEVSKNIEDSNYVNIPIEAYSLMLEILELTSSSSAFEVLNKMQKIKSLVESAEHSMEETNNQLRTAQHKIELFEKEILRLRKVARENKVSSEELTTNLEFGEYTKDKIDEDDFLAAMSLDPD